MFKKVTNNCDETAIEEAQLFDDGAQTITAFIGGAEDNGVIQPHSIYNFDVYAINEAGASSVDSVLNVESLEAG